jgi:hypothetical protein
MNLLETVITVPVVSISFTAGCLATHASTQHIKTNPVENPTYGIFCKANDTAREVKTITTLYADVAIAVTIPVYVTAWTAV